jgi:hypothetical protein
VTISDNENDASNRESNDDPFFAYKPKLAGAPWMFWLRRDGLEWTSGRYRGLIPYNRIRRVRLMFRPVTLQSYRFIAEIWANEAPKLQIASSTWRSLVMQDRLDQPYVAFVTELHRRLAAAGGATRFDRGMPYIAFVVGFAAFIGALVAFAVLSYQAVLLAEWKAIAVIAVLLAVFMWQVGSYFTRNWPGSYRPDAIPPQLLPKV